MLLFLSVLLSWPENWLPCGMSWRYVMTYSFAGVCYTFYWEKYVPVCRRRKGGSWLRQQVASCLRGLSGHDLRHRTGLNLWWSPKKHWVLVAMGFTAHIQTDIYTHTHKKEKHMSKKFCSDPMNCCNTHLLLKTFRKRTSVTFVFKTCFLLFRNEHLILCQNDLSLFNDLL